MNLNEQFPKNNFETMTQRFEPIAEPDVTLALLRPRIHFGINVRFRPEEFAATIRWSSLNRFVFLGHD